jgi:uncharacterized surface protein with fasciclin (FAS1) repeats
MKSLFKWLVLVPIVLAFTITQPSCRKQHLDVLTDTTVSIVGYLKKNPSRFTNIIKMLDRVNISPFLNAYGAYTFFAPTDDAIAIYLKKYNKSSVDDLDTATVRSICRFHIIQDTLTTRNFTDGKLPTITMYGQYLITGVGTAKDGSSVPLVNRQALVTLPNVLTGNGYVHEIDHVLEPATQTIAQMITADSRYTIYAQALKATGLYDSLNQPITVTTDTTRRFLTFLAETDSVLKVAGYPSYTALKTRFSNTGNPASHNDSLYLYMAYHIITGPNSPRYVADILGIQSIPTIVPQQVTTVTYTNNQVLLNQATFNGVFEAGVQIDRPNSDNTAANGVVHTLLGDVFIKIRQPYGVYFDVADQPEIRKLTSVFRKAGKSQTFVTTAGASQIAGISTDGNSTYANVVYSVESASSANFYYWDDHLGVTLKIASGQPSYVEFTTPLIVQGTYKVWVCYRSSGGSTSSSAMGGYVQASFDGNPLSRILDLRAYLASTSATDAVLEAQGYKRYSTKLGGVGTGSSNNAAQLAGVINVTTTDVHKIRLTCIKTTGSGTNGVNIDMIQFIPVNIDQQYPRFERNGTIVADINATW